MKLENDNTVNTKQRFKILNFNQAYEAPKNKINLKKGVVEWGDKNNYPNYILDLYNYKGSTTHKSIINKKVKLISGKGFKDIVDPLLLDFVDKTNLTKEIKNATLDYELFNGFAFEVIWNNEGTGYTSIKSIPLHKLRIGVENDDIKFPHYLFSNDWSQTNKKEFEPQIIRAFNPYIKQGKQIYVHFEYNPATSGTYPIVDYSTSINWIELDYEISKFHLNQAKQGYAPSFILNFATGIPTQEEQEEFYKEFKKAYAGSENAGNLIITYSEGSDGKPELIAISLNDSDKRFTMLIDQIENQIVRGAEIPPQLVILTPGKLGSTQERDELMLEFQQSYITPRQETLEYVINNILYVAGFTEDLKLREYIETNNDVPVSDKQTEAQATLKGSVGGVQALLQIQTSVASGITSRSSAIAAIELLYGFSTEEANRLLGDVNERTNTNTNTGI